MNDSQFEAETERKVKSLKKAILNELSVSQKLKRLKKEEEDKKRKIEEKIKEKEAREIIKLKNHKLFEIRDERIKEILQKKKKEEEEHEIKGLQYSVQMKSKEKLAGLPSFHTTPQHQHTRVNLNRAVKTSALSLSNSTQSTKNSTNPQNALKNFYLTRKSRQNR
jgi:predicted Holliday junction resolvase-like endonuclease